MKQRKRGLRCRHEALLFAGLVAVLPCLWSEKNSIPAKIHFIYFPPDDLRDLTLHHFLAIYAAHETNGDCQILLHTSLNLIRSSYKQPLYQLSRLSIIKASAPKMTRKGAPIVNRAHQSDFYRLEILLKHGGIYCDLDAFLLRSLRGLRNAGFATILGQIDTLRVGSGLIMSSKTSKTLRMFQEKMQNAFERSSLSWDGHSVIQLSSVVTEVFRLDSELLLLPPSAFFPLGADPNEIKLLHLPNNFKYNFRTSFAMHGFETSFSGRKEFQFDGWEDIKKLYDRFTSQIHMTEKKNLNNSNYYRIMLSLLKSAVSQGYLQ